MDDDYADMCKSLGIEPQWFTCNGEIVMPNLMHFDWVRLVFGKLTSDSFDAYAALQEIERLKKEIVISENTLVSLKDALIKTIDFYNNFKGAMSAKQ